MPSGKHVDESLQPMCTDLVEGMYARQQCHKYSPVLSHCLPWLSVSLACHQDEDPSQQRLVLHMTVIDSTAVANLTES